MKNIIGAIRGPFLLLPPVCVLLGLASTVYSGKEINYLYLIIAFIGALTAHISVNVFNEYFDFKSGLDSLTKRTPFSGGSGTLQAQPKNLKPVFLMSIISFSITGLIGLFFIYTRGLGILPIGLIGLAIIFLYTKWLTKSPILCLIAPGLGFGPLMVIGTSYVISGEYLMISFIVSLIPFFLVSNLLLLNQFPDVEADKTVGRKHFPILIGRKKSSIIFILFLVATYSLIGFSVIKGFFPVYTLIGMITILLAIPVSINAFKNSNKINKLIPFMGMNVVINLLTPILVSIGFYIA